jgi:hypothetical protein
MVLSGTGATAEASHSRIRAAPSAHLVPTPFVGDDPEGPRSPLRLDPAHRHGLRRLDADLEAHRQYLATWHAGTREPGVRLCRCLEPT